MHKWNFLAIKLLHNVIHFTLTNYILLHVEITYLILISNSHKFIHFNYSSRSSLDEIYANIQCSIPNVLPSRKLKKELATSYPNKFYLIFIFCNYDWLKSQKIKEKNTMWILIPISIRHIRKYLKSTKFIRTIICTPCLVSH